MPLGCPPFLYPPSFPSCRVGFSNRLLVGGMERELTFWWLGIIAEMQSADSGNQFNFCCSVTRRGEGQEGQGYFESHCSVKEMEYSL